MLKVCIRVRQSVCLVWLASAVKLLACLVISLVLVACGSKPVSDNTRAPVVVAEKKVAPVFTPEQELKYGAALDLAKRGRTSEAKRSFEALVKEVPNMAGAWVNLGMIALETKEFDKADELFNKALNINPDNAAAHLGLSELDNGKGNFKAAAQKLERAVSLKGDYWRAHYKLGVLYDLYLGDKSKALKHYRSYVGGSKQSDVELVANWIKLLELEQ